MNANSFSTDGQGLSGKKMDELAVKATETVYGKGNKYGDCLRYGIDLSREELEHGIIV